MSHVTRKQDRPEDADSPGTSLAASTRVDAPHVAAEAAAPAAMESSPSSIAGAGEFQSSVVAAIDASASGMPRADGAADEIGSAVQIVQQVRTQAAQLATHLRRQQAAIDHREAELNARTGTMEAQFRSARLWLGERQQEFAEMRAELDAREKAVEVRSREIAEADAACRALRASTEQELRSRETALETREAALAARLAVMMQGHESMQANLTQTQEQFQKQESALAEREMQLNALQASCIEREQEIQRRQAAIEAGIACVAELDNRQVDLETRLAEVAAAQAACEELRKKTENDLRVRQATLETRETVLTTRLSEVVGNRKSVKAAWDEALEHFRQQELALANREAELNEANALCVKREQELVRRQAALDAERARFTQQVARGDRGDDSDQRLAELAARTRQLNEAESLLAAEQADLQRARESYYGEQKRWQDEIASARHKLREDRQQFIRDVERKKQLLRRRRDDLDLRHAAVKQLRAEVSHTQQETLELRVATEELWARLCGTMAPATLTQSLGQIRLKLAEHNRLAETEIAEQREELHTLGARLSDQHEKLQARRNELQAWAKRRTADVEQQAALLVAREQELDRQENEMRQTTRRHQEERRTYQQEIRKLMRKLREADPELATA